MSMEINQVLQQMRSMQIAATGDVGIAPTRVEGQLDFGNVLKDSLTAVSDTQRESADISLAYASGDESVDLAQVMISMQKASLSFEAVTQVRNKLLSAYQEVMNMQV
jgi:flagellar hook-basal body complex protein FliE